MNTASQHFTVGNDSHTKVHVEEPTCLKWREHRTLECQKKPQQGSHHGDPGGSVWSGKPWRSNPVQGGSSKGANAKTLVFRESACSYVAPIRTVTLKKNEVVGYGFFLTIVPLDEIRARFEKLTKKP